jgi:cob(I)alamin adenosyltransferase
MLYTGKGDNGTTKLFDSKSGERVSKSSMLFEALGTLDELNSYLGLCKVLSKEKGFILKDINSFGSIVHDIQQNLFIIQAELAGSEMTINIEKVKEIENIINKIEIELPPIKTFFISGGTELSSRFDVARTIARRTERRVVSVFEEGSRKISDDTRAYLNRLSSLLYALARHSNHLDGITEEPPLYK